MWKSMSPGGATQESMYISLKSKVIGSNVSVSRCQRLESRGLWVECGRKKRGGGAGKNIGDLMLFWETNKGANAAHHVRHVVLWVATQAGRCEGRLARHWWPVFHNWAGEWWNSIRRSNNRCICVWLCAYATVCAVFGRLSRSEQLSCLVITSQQKQAWQTEEREGERWINNDLLNCSTLICHASMSLKNIDLIWQKFIFWRPFTLELAFLLKVQLKCMYVGTHCLQYFSYNRT